MYDDLKRQPLMQVVVGLFALLSLWWVVLHTIYAARDVDMQLFAAVYGVMALVGALAGFHVAQTWGYAKSLMGKAIIMFSLGLLAQEFGQLAYSFYIYFLHIEVPYPSLGDIGFFGSIPLYIYGAYLLAKASGAKVSSKSIKNQLSVLLVPVIVLGFSYYKFLQGYEFDWTSPLIVFLDFGYPLGQAIYVSVAFLTYFLSRGILGGVMRRKILFVLVALFIQYFADYTFLYQVSQGTWIAGGSNDYLYLVSYFVMTLALLNLRVSLVRDKLA